MKLGLPTQRDRIDPTDWQLKHFKIYLEIIAESPCFSAFFVVALYVGWGEILMGWLFFENL